MTKYAFSPDFLQEVIEELRDAPRSNPEYPEESDVLLSDEMVRELIKIVKYARKRRIKQLNKTAAEG
jgi:hypothetical protein